MQSDAAFPPTLSSIPAGDHSCLQGCALFCTGLGCPVVSSIQPRGGSLLAVPPWGVRWVQAGLREC